MPTLLVLRHAKAAPYVDSDSGRPLAARGREQCSDVARHFRKLLLQVSDARVSPAQRTQETWQRVCAAAEVAPRASLDQRIYEGTAGSLLDVVQELSGEVCAVVGHNPGVARLALLLATDCDADQLRFLQHYGTGSAALLECDEPWARWQPGCARIVELFAPAE